MSDLAFTGNDIQQILQSVGSISPLIKKLEEPSFPTQLWLFLDEFVRYGDSCVYLVRRNAKPVRLSARGEEDRARDYWHHFLEEKVFTLNPYYNKFLAGELFDGFHRVTDVAPDDFKNSEYYKIFYRPSYDFGDADEGMFVANIDSDNALLLSLERGRGFPSFSEKDLARCHDLAPLISSLCYRNWYKAIGELTINGDQEITVYDEIIRAFDQFGCHVLTQREQEVAALMLQGHSSKSAAGELNISPGTERVHRKRLYAKLNISSLAELFALFFKSIAYLGKGENQDLLEDYIKSKLSHPPAPD